MNGGREMITEPHIVLMNTCIAVIVLVGWELVENLDMVTHLVAKIHGILGPFVCR